MRANGRHHLFTHRSGIVAVRLHDQVVGAKIRRHHDQHIAKIHRTTLAVGQATLVKHLQQDVEDIDVRLLDLVEQQHLIGPPPHGFRQRAAFLVADVTGWGADQAGDRMLLHVFRHVDANHRRLIVEKE